MGIMGIDYGERRIGVAISDETQTLATGVETINWNGTDPEWAETRIQTLVEERKVTEIVIGRPRRTDGRTGRSEENAVAMAERLAEKTGVSVVMRDERYTTVIASRMMKESGTKPRRKREVVDQIAAAVILQDYLDERRR